MDGLHLTADLIDCAPGDALTRPSALRALCRDAVAQSGLIAVDDLFHAFPPPGGVTGVVLLKESHLAIHTWPELGAVTLDAFVCNVGQDNSARAQALIQCLVAAFAPRSVQRQCLHRGALARALDLAHRSSPQRGSDPAARRIAEAEGFLEDRIAR